MFVVSTGGNPPTPHPRDSVPVITDFVTEFQCNFESGLCGMTQDVADEDDFIFNSGPTPNNNTGPSGDYDTGNGTVFAYNLYLFTVN